MLIGVAGMVGVGKTTITLALARHLSLKTILETVDQRENPLLTRFYEEEDGQRRYALPLQLFFLEDRVSGLQRVRRDGGRWVTDQLLYIDAEVFARGHFDAGVLRPDEWALYQRRYEEILANAALPVPDLVVYLSAPLYTILARIERRARPGEAETDVAYWQALHERYSRWIAEFDRCPVLHVDARDYDVVSDPTATERIARDVVEAIGPIGASSVETA